jgi:hypothetical protein
MLIKNTTESKCRAFVKIEEKSTKGVPNVPEKLKGVIEVSMTNLFYLKSQIKGNP